MGPIFEGVASRSADWSGPLGVAVAESIFRPLGGGPPADSGWVNGVSVNPVRDHESGLVVLAASSAEPLPDYFPGHRFSIRIDADLRLLHAEGYLIEAAAREWPPSPYAVAPAAPEDSRATKDAVSIGASGMGRPSALFGAHFYCFPAGPG